MIDLIRTGKSSTYPNYILPSFLGIQICVAYLLGTKINSDLLKRKSALPTLMSPKRKDRAINIWSIITVVILTGGIISSTNDFQAQTWWNWSKFDVEAAKIINKASNPLIISEASLGAIAPLTYLLDSNTNIMLINSGNLEVKPDYSNIFFYQISDDSLLKISKNLFLTIDTVYRFEEDSLVVKLFQVKK